jgi:uncharacterized protein
MAKVYAYAPNFAKDQQGWESEGFCDFIFSTRMHVFKRMRFMLALLFLFLCLPHFLEAEDRGLWSNLGIIDIHAHIGSFRGYDIGLQPLLTNLNKYGLRMALISNLDGCEMADTKNLNEVLANQATAAAVRDHPQLLRGLIWTRPEDGSAETVERFLQTPYEHLFVGMKFHPEFNHFDADDPRVDPYLALCERYKVPAVFHCGADGSKSSASKIYAIARRHPSVPIVLYHMGFLASHQSAIDAVLQSITRMDARLYLELSQVSPQDALAAIRKVGSDRVLFGTDATYYGADHYGSYRSLVALLQNDLSAADLRKVLSGNAENLFQLSAQPQKH